MTESSELNEEDGFLSDFVDDKEGTLGSHFAHWLYNFVTKKLPMGTKGGPEVDRTERAVLAVLVKHHGYVEAATGFAKEVQQQTELGAYGSPQTLKIPAKIRDLSTTVTKRFRNWLVQQRQILSRSADVEAEGEDQQEQQQQQQQTFAQLTEAIVTKCMLLLRFKTVEADFADSSLSDPSSPITLPHAIRRSESEKESGEIAFGRRAALYSSTASVVSKGSNNNSKLNSADPKTRGKLMQSMQAGKTANKEQTQQQHSRYYLLWNFISQRKKVRSKRTFM